MANVKVTGLTLAKTTNLYKTMSIYYDDRSYMPEPLQNTVKSSGGFKSQQRQQAADRAPLKNCSQGPHQIKQGPTKEGKGPSGTFIG